MCCGAVTMDPMVENPARNDPIARSVELWRERGWSDAASGMELVALILRARQLLLTEAERLLGPLGLTFSRFEVLRLLAFSRRGELPMGVVSSHLQVHAASATHSVTRLANDGFVERSTGANDRRVIVVTLTDSGRNLVERATDLLNRSLFSTLPIDTDEETSLIGQLRRLRDGLER